jgi:cytochrome P450
MPRLINKAVKILTLWLSKNNTNLPPPGKPVLLTETERYDRNALLKLAHIHGSIFSASDIEGPMVCIVGLPLGRRFLKENAANLRPVTLDVSALFPKGFMRQMEGNTHKAYRKALKEAVSTLVINDMADVLVAISAARLQSFAEENGEKSHTSHAYMSALSDIATGLLLRVFFGVKPDVEHYGRLMGLFKQLGPHGLVWNIGEPQVSAFNALRDELLKMAQAVTINSEAIVPNCIFYSMVKQDTLDDTSLGNIIYMVEMGRYDMKGLFRWISKFAADTPSYLSRIAKSVESNDAVESGALTQAFVQETLRMDQSERLMREVKDDIEFAGFLIPKGWRARICLWEIHKDSSVFPQPFKFDPSRFLSSRPTPDEYSPFGLDNHQCPFAGIAMSLGGYFLQALASGYQVTPVNQGTSVRGGYHWEPAPNFSVVLASRHCSTSEVVN